MRTITTKQEREAGAPTLETLTGAVREIQRDYAHELRHELREDGIDVRLQIHDGSWQLHTGDASYDQDHSGAWGASAILRESRPRDVARELLDQALEQLAEVSR